MKRPDGFDDQLPAKKSRPPASASSPTPPARDEISGVGGKGPGKANARTWLGERLHRPTRAGTTPGPSADDTETGPITLPRPAAAGSAGQTIIPAQPSVRPAEIRRRARKAARARRRFEHAEVRRFTRRSRRRRATWVTVSAIAAVLAIVLGVAVYSPILALREITIDGTTLIDAAAVQAAVDDQVGTPLALVDFDRIRTELEQFPLIRSYVTETVPPNTLRIHVVERQAIALVKRGDAFDQVDPAGVIISSSAERSDLPLIDIGTNGVTSHVFASAVEVLLAMPASVSGQVDTITAKTADNVALTMKGSAPQVLWGSANNSELKATVLAAMLARPECMTQAAIDVTAPLAPICGPL